MEKEKSADRKVSAFWYHERLRTHVKELVVERF